jgi:hypothetical protein
MGWMEGWLEYIKVQFMEGMKVAWKFTMFHNIFTSVKRVDQPGFVAT